MTINYMTTKEFLMAVKGIGLRADIRAASIEVRLDAQRVATIQRHKLLSFELNTEGLGNGQTTLLINAILCYVNTPVDKRTPKDCKLEIYDTGLYVNHISEHEITVTTNKKAARTYNDAGIYDAKTLADKQGVALVVELVDVDD